MIFAPPMRKYNLMNGRFLLRLICALLVSDASSARLADDAVDGTATTSTTSTTSSTSTTSTTSTSPMAMPPPSVAEASAYQQLTLVEVYKCWKPSEDPNFNYEDNLATVQQEMLGELNAGASPQSPFSPAWMKSALQSFGSAGKVLPNHAFANLLHGYERQASPSVCLDIDLAEENTPDDYGCSFFRRSFTPLRQMHTCIQQVLSNDRYFQLWQMIGGQRSDDAKTFIGLHQDLGVSEDDVDREIESFATCKQKWWCVEMSATDRSFEILKRVAFKAWGELGYDEAKVVADVIKKIVLTRSAPECEGQRRTLVEEAKEKGPPRQINVLEEASVDTIVQCLGLPKNGMAESGKQVEGPVIVNKQAASCLAVAYDTVEVPGPPIQPLYFTNQEAFQAGRVNDLYSEKHPICGRIAVAAMNKIFTAAAYPKGLKAFKLIYLSVVPMHKLSDCLARRHATCRTFAYCWSNWVKYVVGHVAQPCGIVRARLPGFNASLGEMSAEVSALEKP